MTEKDVEFILVIFKFIWDATPYIVGVLVGLYVGIPLCLALFPPDERKKKGD